MFSAFICAFGVVTGANAQSSPDVQVRQVTGAVYEVVAGSQTTMFLVTPEGIILADPLNRPAALHLREILETRFPNATVRYVVYSHHHFDRAEGAGAFGSPEVVAHQEFNRSLDAALHTLPSHVAIVDENLNGAFDAPEIAGSPDAALVLSRDRNGDGTVTPEELYALVRRARTTYWKQLTLRLGGKSVRLIHPGPAYSNDNTILYFPDERVVFAANGPAVEREPFSFSFGVFRPRDVEEWIRTVTSLDLDTLIFGSGEKMTRSRLIALRDYLDGVRAEATAAYARGESLARLQARSGATPERQAQLATVYRSAGMVHVDLTGGAGGNYDRLAAAACATYTSCSGGGAVGAVSASAALVSGSGLGLVAELTVEQQTWMSRARPLYAEEVALRQSRGSVLIRFGPRRDSLFALAGLGGVSTTIIDRRGVASVGGAFVPTGGLHSLHTRDERFGYTGGMDFSIGRRVAFVIPVRVTFTPSAPPYWPSRLNVHVGVDMTAQVFRHVR